MKILQFPLVKIIVFFPANALVYFLEPDPTFRYSPCFQSFFSFGVASASYGRIATPRKNNFQNCGATTAIWGRV